MKCIHTHVAWPGHITITQTAHSSSRWHRRAYWAPVKSANLCK